jgi:vanillate O-demethylase monooxygenase subunit
MDDATRVEPSELADSTVDAPYPRQQWYVAGWSHEITRHPVERRILGESIVLYRTESGAVVALANTCPHRGYPLSKGRLLGDVLECGYHGLSFEASGKCVRVPNQDRVPPGLCVKSYPVVEPHGWIWIWMGDGPPDESRLPDHHWLKSEGYRSTGTSEPLAAPFYICNDNILDIGHISFLHPSTFHYHRGGNAKVTLEQDFTDAHARIVRTIEGEEAPGFYQRLYGITGLINRRFDICYRPPAFTVLEVSITSCATGERYRHYGLIFATPENTVSSRHYAATCRDYRRDDPEVDAIVIDVLNTANREDLAAMADVHRMRGQVANRSRRDEGVGFALKVDAAPLHARRLLRKMIEQERGTPASPEVR